MAVPMRTLVVRIAAAAKIVSVSGTVGVWIIQTCRTPAASAATMVDTAVDAFVPLTTRPTRSCIGFDEDSCTSVDFVSLFCIRQISFNIVAVFPLNNAKGMRITQEPDPQPWGTYMMILDEDDNGLLLVETTK
jgi:hypothetical protein